MRALPCVQTFCSEASSRLDSIKNFGSTSYSGFLGGAEEAMVGCLAITVPTDRHDLACRRGTE